MSKIYINFPISLIPPLYLDKNGHQAITNILYAGIITYCMGRKLTLSEALDTMGLTCRLTESEILDIVNSFPESTVMTSSHLERLFPFKEKSYKDNRDEIITLCGELALRSIIGVKEYAKCYKSLVLSRMSGIAKGMGHECYPLAIQRLDGNGGKRQWRKLIKSLRQIGYSFYTPKGCHGFYTSYKLAPIALAEMVERKTSKKNINSEYDLSNEALCQIVKAKLSRTP